MSKIIMDTLNNAEIMDVSQRNLFLSVVENCEIETLRAYVSLSNDEWRRHIEKSDNENVDYIISDVPSTLTRAGMQLQLLPDDNNGYSVWLEAVWIAHSKSQGEILKILLSDNRFVYQFNEGVDVVFHLAVIDYLADGNEPRKLQTIKILLESGKFNTGNLNSRKETALHVACRSRLNSSSCQFFEILLTILLEYGINVNRRNIDGKTALMLAYENKNDKAADTLLKLSRQYKIYHDFDAVNISNDPVSVAAEERSHPGIKMFTMGDVNCVSGLEAEVLHAIENESKNLVKIVLDEAAYVYEGFAMARIHFSLWNYILKRWDYGRSKFIGEITWKEALRTADENSSEDILKLLLDYDAVVQSQQGENGDPILHRFFHHTNRCDQKQLRLIEILLTSGRINVNAMNCEANSALHTVLKGCHRTVFCHGNHGDDVYESVKLLLRHGINVNLRDKEGKTPLAIACETGCTPMLKGILNWAKRKSTWLDLDARDHNGRTALIKAAMGKYVATVKMLLNAGASVNFSDNRGFTALHHALYETQSPQSWINCGDFPRNFEELKRRRQAKVSLFETEEPFRIYNRNRQKLNEDKTKIVEMLLERSDIGVNALDCEGYSPLDIAEASIPEYPSVVIEVLIDKGATLNAFKHENHQPSGNGESDSRYKNLLHRLCNYTKIDKSYRRTVKRSHLLDSAEENFNKLDLDRRAQLVSAKDEKERTALHWTIVSRQDCETPIANEAIRIAEMLIDTGCCVNETDIYGRTPLHYVDNKNLFLFLLDKGADRTIKDRDGMAATESQFSSLRYPVHAILYVIQERVRQQPTRVRENIKLLHADNKIFWCEHLNPKTIPEILWKYGSYAHYQSTVGRITKDVKKFMKNLAIEIKRRDPRFEVRPMLVGSSYEGTKIDLPTEFDFNLVLTKISQLCEVHQSPELPTGFVRLKRIQNRREDSKCGSFFDENEILITETLNTQFRIILTNVLTDVRFIESQQDFDWNFYLKPDGLVPLDAKSKLATTLKLRQATFSLSDKRRFAEISIDIVPCIHIDGWWPDEAISNVSDDVKAGGCNIVFDYPQRLYPWVPYSEHCARISFAPAESEMIKRSPEEAKQAYMIGKQLITKTKYGPAEWTCAYALKTSLLYCIEACKPTREMASELGVSLDVLKSYFDVMDYRLWLGCLMKCHLDFIAQDFCPCYFMPTFSLPNEKFMKFYHMRCWTDEKSDFFEVYLNSYKLYLSTSFYGLDFRVQLPVVNPIFESFDRSGMVIDLTKSAIRNLETKLYDYDNSEYLYCGGFCETDDLMLP